VGWKGKKDLKYTVQNAYRKVKRDALGEEKKLIKIGISIENAMFVI